MLVEGRLVSEHPRAASAREGVSALAPLCHLPHLLHSALFLVLGFGGGFLRVLLLHVGVELSLGGAAKGAEGALVGVRLALVGLPLVLVEGVP